MNPFPVARAVVKNKVVDDSYEAIAVKLCSHQEAVAKIVEKFFAEYELVKNVALKHDMYKPATMKLEDFKGILRVGFRGHPYMLSFSDFENISINQSVLENTVNVAVATAIGRLHHFINIRDVDSFVYTMAMAKSYLDSRGVRVKLSELKKRVLHGLLVLHVADMVAGFIEQSLLERTSDVELYDTEALEFIEPHLPLSTTIEFADDKAKLRITLHGLSEVLRKEILEKGSSFELNYRVCEGVLHILGESERAVFEAGSCNDKAVYVEVIHKRKVIMDEISRSRESVK